MFTEQEEKVINAAVEKALKMLPDIMGTLMNQRFAMLKLNEEFYKEHPEFKDHKEIVAAVIEKVDGEDTLLPYDQKLVKAIPEIGRRIQMKKDLNMKEIPSTTPSRKMDDSFGNNGVI